MHTRSIILASFLAVSTALAQRPVQHYANQMPAPEPGPRISFVFKGGTVKEYLATLRAVAPKDAPVNVVVTSDVEDEKLPAVEMTNTSVYSAVAALSVLLPRPEFDVNVKVLAQYGPQDPEATAYGVEVSRRFTPPNKAIQSLRVYSVRDVLNADGADSSERVSAETLLTAVKTALGEVPFAEDAPADVKFHPESALLIVRGSDYALDVVKQVVKEISTSVNDEGAARRVAAARKLDLIRCEQRMAVASRTFGTLKQQREQLVKLRDAGSAPASEVLALDLEISRAESEMIVAQAERDAVAEGVTFTPTAAPTPNELIERLAALERLVAELRGQPATKSGRTVPGGK
jgi:hypothetical protein